MTCFVIEKNLLEVNWLWIEKNLVEDDLKRIYWKIIDFGFEKYIKHTIFKQ
jgi:hypothetical protein